ncbi:MAG: type I restriction enzyme HsdR N-terminal domain-containing protein [Ginsengibacter sp.]
MIKISFPKDKVKIQQQEGVNEVFDPIRKKWFLLTPEEWVRQNFLQFLLQKNYPASLIAIEKEIKLGELKKRCDLVIYNRSIDPWMIIECKEMNISLSESTIRQILQYHITLPAKFLIITNGSYSYGFEKISNQFFEMDTFPDYEI